MCPALWSIEATQPWYGLLMSLTSWSLQFHAFFEFPYYPLPVIVYYLPDFQPLKAYLIERLASVLLDRCRFQAILVQALDCWTWCLRKRPSFAPFDSWGQSLISSLSGTPDWTSRAESSSLCPECLTAPWFQILCSSSSWASSRSLQHLASFSACYWVPWWVPSRSQPATQCVTAPLVYLWWAFPCFLFKHWFSSTLLLQSFYTFWTADSPSHDGPWAACPPAPSAAPSRRCSAATR